MHGRGFWKTLLGCIGREGLFEPEGESEKDGPHTNPDERGGREFEGEVLEGRFPGYFLVVVEAAGGCVEAAERLAEGETEGDGAEHGDDGGGGWRSTMKLTVEVLWACVI